MQISQLLKEPGALIIDVRTPAEFMGGHVNGSINIPLSDVPNRIEDFRNAGKPVVLCCASGNRSGQATYFLQNQGFENIFNGGSWLDVNYFMNN
ncbi:MAG: rhodanese-like domain-containing protein [Flavobacteriales bacterium]|jgi:rhodanese-related sulfurtransferase